MCAAEMANEVLRIMKGNAGMESEEEKGSTLSLKPDPPQ